MTAPRPVTANEAGEGGPRTAREMLALAREFLERKQVTEPRLDAELLVAHALGLDRLHLFLDLERRVEPGEVARARELLVRRGRREPTAYLIGRREFFGRDFAVGPGVLVPRPETELLVDLAREHGAGRPGLRVLDFGTGSGCLAVTLALELDGPLVTAVDVSPEALRCAEGNAATHGVEVDLRRVDGLASLAGERFDLVVSNPPYVDRDAGDELAPEVRDHEPPEALFAPAGAPDHWAHALVAAGPELLADGGVLLIELGHDQGARLASVPGGRLRDDLAGVQRVLEWRPPGAPAEAGSGGEESPRQPPYAAT